jgi:Uma2 family endonuclease
MPRMPPPAPVPPGVRSFGDFLRWLGDVSPDRIPFRPPPGMANVDDVLRLERRENRLCELVEGVLVEKRLGYRESAVAAALLEPLRVHVEERQLGVVTGPEGVYRLRDKLARIPAVAFCAAKSYPGDATPGEGAPKVIPTLAVELASEGHSADELTRRIGEYFEAGVKLLWVVDLASRSVTAYNAPGRSKTIDAGGTLDGGKAVPGFKLPVAALFGHLSGGKRGK